MPTFTPKKADIERQWHVVDAEGMVLGRLSTEVAHVLRGKHKPTFSPHMDCGDHVVVINADKVVLTAGKAERKQIYRHSGYPGGIRSRTYADRLADEPAEAVRSTICGMLPKNRLGKQVASKLKVYAGPTHPHTAQKPEPLVFEHARGSRLIQGSRFMSTEIARATGRRKRAVARVRLSAGTGTITVNDRTVDDYFPSAADRMILTEPLRLTELSEAYDIDVTMHGGGRNGQAGALRLGIARALIEVQPELRDQVKKAGFLTRDARKKESKKYGLKKARKAPQYSKR